MIIYALILVVINIRRFISVGDAFYPSITYSTAGGWGKLFHSSEGKGKGKRYFSFEDFGGKARGDSPQMTDDRGQIIGVTSFRKRLDVGLAHCILSASHRDPRRILLLRSKATLTLAFSYLPLSSGSYMHFLA